MIQCRSCLSYAIVKEQAQQIKLCRNGDNRDRTGDLRLAKPALSQLSYIPGFKWWAYLESNQGPHTYQACALTI